MHKKIHFGVYIIRSNNMKPINVIKIILYVGMLLTAIYNKLIREREKIDKTIDKASNTE